MWNKSAIAKQFSGSQNDTANAQSHNQYEHHGVVAGVGRNGLVVVGSGLGLDTLVLHMDNEVAMRNDGPLVAVFGNNFIVAFDDVGIELIAFLFLGGQDIRIAVVGALGASDNDSAAQFRSL